MKELIERFEPAGWQEQGLFVADSERRQDRRSARRRQSWPVTLVVSACVGVTTLVSAVPGPNAASEREAHRSIGMYASDAKSNRRDPDLVDPEYWASVRSYINSVNLPEPIDDGELPDPEI